MYGDISDSGDASGNPGKSSLFFLTARLRPGIGLPGDRVSWLAKQRNLGTVRCVLVGP
jgi:hypothetical protein